MVVAPFVPVAVEAAVFDCVTLPPPPGLLTRTGDASFDGASCAAKDAARPSCPVHDFWPSAWIWRPPPASLCVPFCWVEAVLPAFAADAAVFDWVTSPSLPQLPTRTGEAVFPAPEPPHPHGERSLPKSCTAPDNAIAAWSVPACWPSTWMPRPPQPHLLPATVWFPVWFVVAALLAFATDDAVFDCLTEPPLPGLSTRTGDASFDAPICFAKDAASAPCSVLASCPAIWMPLPA